MSSELVTETFFSSSLGTNYKGRKKKPWFWPLDNFLTINISFFVSFLQNADAEVFCVANANNFGPDWIRLVIARAVHKDTLNNY